MSSTGRWLVLTEGARDDASFAMLRACFKRAELAWETDAGPLGVRHAQAVALLWGADVSRYIDTCRPGAALHLSVRDSIRGAFEAGTPILAPCVSAVVVIDALAGFVGASDLTMRHEPGGLAVYPRLRTVGTNRPLIGQNESRVHAQLDAALERVMQLATERRTSLARLLGGRQ